MNTQTLNWPIIRKSSPWPGDIAPNVLDYDAMLSTFTWDSARAALDGLPAGAGLNIAHEAVDRHAAGAHADRVAFRWIARDGSITEATYAELAARTNRFANALRGLGIGKGERVFTLLGTSPGAVRHRHRHAQERECAVATVLRVRARADPSAPRTR